MTNSKTDTMRWVLWLNTVAETIIAFGMFFAPAAFFPGAEGLSSSIARAFSFAIFAVAFISFTAVWKSTPMDTVKNVVTILLFYHIFQLIAQFVNGVMYPPMLIPPVAIHSVFTVLFGAYFFRLRSSVI
ncbi:MAG: hypothetical protein PSX36_09370 [bacterium]|nr:hypothetical protein [bacterium]